MSYVMVPVPEEIKDQVNTVLAQIAFRDALSNWDPDALGSFISEVSDSERSLIGTLVEAAVENTTPTRKHLIESLGMPEEDLDNIIMGLNRRASGAGNPWLIMVTRGEDSEGVRQAEVVYVASKVADIINGTGLLDLHAS